MASTIYDVVEIKLIDDSVIKLRPLKIKLLREFMTKFKDLGDLPDDEDASINLLLDCVQIAMKQFRPELAEDREALEDVMDLPTVYKVIEVASGIKLNDPNLMAAGLDGTI